jgi:glutamate N-acetyltransferase/amino-acid N-acetyltransferase
MLAFVTTDAVIARNVLQKALDAAVKESFNRVTVDGDTSTNDTVLVLANSQAGNVPIGNNTASFKAFSDALAWVLKQLAWKVVSDGEGVTKVFRVVVQGAANGSDAEKVCRAVACSPLVKTAVFGEDFNWGRIVNAAGYSGASFDADRLDISFDSVPVIVKGRPVPKNFGRAEKVFRKDRFDVRIGLNAGRAESYVFTTDFSYDYVRINADYRS